MIGLATIKRYRNTLILAAVAAASAGAAWQAQGWRLGRQMAKAEAAHSQADVRRGNLANKAWADATKGAMDTLRRSKAALAAQRLANAELLRQVQLAQPKDPAYACRALPLPDTYLEQFRK